MSKSLRNVIILILTCLLIMGIFPAIAQAKSVENSSVTCKTVQLLSGDWRTTVYNNGYKLYTYKTSWKPKVKIVYNEDLSCEKLVNRQKNHVIYISYFYGKCINDKKDGKIITDSPYNYTSYKGAHNVRKGDLVKTYLIYNPWNNYEDDIIDRIDNTIS